MGNFFGANFWLFIKLLPVCSKGSHADNAFPVIFRSQGQLGFQAPAVITAFDFYWLMRRFLPVISFQSKEHCFGIVVFFFLLLVFQLELELTWPLLFNCFCLPREDVSVHQIPSTFRPEPVNMSLKL